MADSQPDPQATSEQDEASAVAPSPAKTRKVPVAQPQIDPGKPKRKLLPPYKVILHNDDVNEMFHVVQTVITLTPLGRTQALQRMWEAHRSGSSMLLVTHRERAELYVEQFASCGLTVTAEPDA